MDRRIGAELAQQGIGRASRIVMFAMLMLAISACKSIPRIEPNDFDAIEASMAQHINVLASDDFGGRLPGSEGERKTLDYLRRQLESRGLVSGTNDPANPWLAPVELVRTAATQNRVEFVVDDKRITLPVNSAFATTNLRRSLLDYAPLLFVGNSELAPAQDQFVGQVVVLIGRHERTIAQRDAAFDAGAAAVLQVLEDASLVASAREARSTERFRLAGEERDELTLFVSRDAFVDVIGQSRWEELSAAADREGFRPRELGISARIEASSRTQAVTSHNLIGRLAGSLPGSGAIVLMGHWDHFGSCGTQDAIDQICNGAVDNASGIASLIELSGRLAESGPHDRDIYILATTAEEWGLLGAKAFLARPSLPPEEIVATFNFDSVAIAPRGTPVAFVGQGYTPLDQIVLSALARNGRTLGSQIAADRFLKRQDSWALLEAGIPALALTSALGSDEPLEQFLRDRYHQASDNAFGLELGGAVEDLLLHQDLVEELASVERYPGPAK